MALGRRAFGRWLGHEVGAFTNGISALLRKTQRALLSLHVRVEQEVAVCSPEKTFSRTQPCRQPWSHTTSLLDCKENTSVAHQLPRLRHFRYGGWNGLRHWSRSMRANPRPEETTELFPAEISIWAMLLFNSIPWFKKKKRKVCPLAMPQNGCCLICGGPGARGERPLCWRPHLWYEDTAARLQGFRK